MKPGFDVAQKQRLKKLLTSAAIILAAGIAYSCVVRLTGIGIPCLIKLITGRYCPGCGISRMFLALQEGDFSAAARYNLLVLCLLPFLLIFGIRRAVRFVKFGNTPADVIETSALVIAFAATVLFWVLRNTQTFAWLAPPM